MSGAEAAEVDAKAKMDRARACIRTGELEEGVSLCDEVYRRFTLSKSPALQLQVARALANRGAAISEMGMEKEALVHFDEVERRFWSPRQPELWEGVAWAMLYRARVLLEMEQEPMASNWLERMLSRFGAVAERPGLHVPMEMARTVVNAAHLQAQRYEEALSLSEKLLEEYGEATEPFRVELTAVVLLQRASALQGLGHWEEALEAFDDVEVRHHASTDPRMRALVASALTGRALIYLQEELLPEALAALDAILEHTGPEPGRRMMDCVSFARFQREAVERQLEVEREQAARRRKRS
jgi:tetratricopeptide (TPR) repeat protein